MRPIVVIVGATATGKSRLGLALAQEIGGEIINADALQVYRGFDIGTAKPSADERRRVRHHLVDILEPHEPFSAGEFARRARQVIAQIQDRRGVAVVVGGSGLYLRALLEGLSPIPPVDVRVRRQLQERLEKEGLAPIRQELERVDPATAARLTAGDTQRVLRALEVAVSSGRRLSEWIAGQPERSRPISAVRVGLTLPRPILYDRIGARARGMVDRGWVAEVSRLLNGGLETSLPAFKAIGYRQLAFHVLGQWSLSRALEETIRATRRFAKRQETWFRKEPDVCRFEALELDRRIPDILDYLQRSGLGRDNEQA